MTARTYVVIVHCSLAFCYAGLLHALWVITTEFTEAFDHLID
jgi:hypothetical protein